jgi:hypothetical protein
MGQLVEKCLVQKAATPHGLTMLVVACVSAAESEIGLGKASGAVVSLVWVIDLDTGQEDKGLFGRFHHRIELGLDIKTNSKAKLQCYFKLFHLATTTVLYCPTFCLYKVAVYVFSE